MKTNKYPSAATQINRNFYTNLRNNGRSHQYIMDIIKPDRKAQFRMDIMPLLEEPKKPLCLKRLLNLFK